MFSASIILNANVVLPEPDIPVTQMCLGQSCSLRVRGNYLFPAYEIVANS